MSQDAPDSLFSPISCTVSQCLRADASDDEKRATGQELLADMRALFPHFTGKRVWQATHVDANADPADPTQATAQIITLTIWRDAETYQHETGDMS